MPESRTDKELLSAALADFRVAVDLTQEQVKRELDDLRFEFDPWPEEVKKQRGGIMINGVPIPPRPMLSIPTLDQPVQLVLNQQKAAHIGVQIHPISDDASDETAAVLQDLYRDIETKSRASIARDWAFDRAVKCGRGAYRVDCVFTDEDVDGPGFADQKIVINRILNQGTVFLDPMAQQPDWSDGRFAFVGGMLSEKVFRQEFPRAKMSSFDDQDFASLGDSLTQWVAVDEEGNRSIRVMEYWVVDIEKRVRCAYQDATGQQTIGWKDEIADDVLILSEREVPSQKVWWYKINGAEVLDKQEWDGQYIPIIPVVGREANVDGLRRWSGIVGPAKDAARLFNYGVSSAVETAALATKAPWMIAEGQEEGHEQEFLNASVRNFPYLRYKPTTIMGQPVGPPQRIQASADISSALAIIQQAKDYVHTATFAFEPTLGQASANRSGKAVLALQQQSDAGNSNYLDNLAQVSMTYEARVILDLIPKKYDRPGRVVQLIGKDDLVSTVMLNQPFLMNQQTKKPVPAVAQQVGMPPSMPPPHPGMPPQPAQAPPPVKHYDLTKGRYGVTVSVGKAYQTRLQQGSDAIGQLMQAEPSLVPILGWRWAKMQEFPGHNEIADDLKKLRPPILQNAEDPNAAQQKLAQQTQVMEQMKQALEKMQRELETKQAEQGAKMASAQIQAQTTLEKARMDNETKLAVAELGAKVDRMTLFLEERARLGIQQHDVQMASADAVHQAEMSERSHEQGLESQQRDQQAAQQQQMMQQAQEPVE